MQSCVFIRCILVAAAGLCAGRICAQTSTLALSSGVAVTAGTANLALSVASVSGSEPAALQWTLAYPSTITSVAVTAGPVLATAGKTLDCTGGAGMYTCVAKGLNTSTIGNGLLANVSVALAAGAGSASIGVSSPAAVSPAGDPVGVTATGGSVSAAPVGLTALACAASTLTPGMTTSCSVTVGAPVSSSTAVAVTAGSSALVVPSSVVLPASATSASFNVTAGPFSSDQSASLTASLNGSSSTTNLFLSAPVSISSFQCGAASLWAGMSTTCAVMLSKAAVSGALISLSSNTSAVSVPSAVTVPSGGSSVSFSATAVLSLSQITAATLTAILGAQSVATSISIMGSASALSIWSPSAAPSIPWVNTNGAGLTVGLKFQSDIGGSITGMRFYKGSGNNGTHVGLLYSSVGALLAQAAFTGESASGWQQVTFDRPVAIAASTVYVVALFTNTGCAADSGYFAGRAVDNPPLHALASGVNGGNGVYASGGAPAFPNLSSNATNYWVDVAFTTTSAASSAALTPTAGGSLWSASAVPGTPWVATAGPLTVGVKFHSDVAGTVVGVRFYRGLGSGSTGTHIGLLYSSAGTLLAQALFSGETASGWQQVNFSAPVAIAANATYVVALYTDSGCAYDSGYFTAQGVDNGHLHAAQSTASSGNGVYAYGNTPMFPSSTINGSNYWVDLAFSPTTVPAGTTPAPTVSVWGASDQPMTPLVPTAGPLTVGMKFRADVNGAIKGIRFYKGAGNNGTHIGLLYSSSGTLLAQVNFTAETTSGWQEADFTSPVAIAANTTYIVAFYTDSGCAFDSGYFTSKGVDNGPLHALQSGVNGPNGVYVYSNAPQFPALSYSDANYWVDVAFTSN